MTTSTPSIPHLMGASDSAKAITESLPPATDYLTYLTILESHLSPEILPTLNDILQDTELTQNIGWDLIHPLISLPGSEACLGTIARLGNPREVVLKVTEALTLLELDADAEGTGVEEEVEGNVQGKVEGSADETAGKVETKAKEPTHTDKFCTLVNLLAIVHPRIKTKYPSRFLSTSLISILAAFRPSNQAILAVISFVHTLSGQKRPALPGRKSSLNIPTNEPVKSPTDAQAPDPEAQEEDPAEAGIQAKLLQSFITHVLEEYVNANTLEWAARLQEYFEPKKVVFGRKSLGEVYKEDPAFEVRDTTVGKLVAIARDAGLTEYSLLVDSIYRVDDKTTDEETEEDNYPSSPEDVPLSRAGSLFLVTYFVFSSVLFGTKYPQPSLSIFPDHTKLVKQFIGVKGPQTIGSEPPGVVDAVLSIGLWLENNNRFVSGPLDDEDFLQHLQTLSLLSANNPSPTLRAGAHILTSSVLHAHPTDRLRLTFISDTLEHCPYDSLKASAVSWLKEEIITAHQRKSENIFASTAALAAVQSYLFPDLSSLSQASDEELLQELEQVYPFHMAVVNFLYFVGGKEYSHVVPNSMMAVVEELYLAPLRDAQARTTKALDAKAEPEETKTEVQLLGERIALCSTQIDDR